MRTSALALSGVTRTAGAHRLIFDGLPRWALPDFVLLLAGPLAAAALVLLSWALLRAWSRQATWAAVALAAIAAGFQPFTPGWVSRGDASWFNWRIPGPTSKTLSQTESELLAYRHFAYWLVPRASRDRVVLSSPLAAGALRIYGGFSVAGRSADPKEFGALLTITAAPTLVGAEELLRAHRIGYVVVPTWDRFFADYARYLPASFSGRRGALVPALAALPPPLWLRPLAYQSPLRETESGQAIRAYEVVSDQAPAIAASRDVEYEIEMGRLDRAAIAAAALLHYPGDIGAMTARAQLAFAQGDTSSFAALLSQISLRLQSHADRFLPWDRRVSLVIVLAQGDQSGLAQEQVSRCLREATLDKIQGLSAGSLGLLLRVANALRVDFPDPNLKARAAALLPDGLRA